MRLPASSSRLLPAGNLRKASPRSVTTREGQWRRVGRPRPVERADSGPGRWTTPATRPARIGPSTPPDGGRVGGRTRRRAGCSTARRGSIRTLLDAGVSVRRAHDVRLTERILLGRDGRFAEPVSAAAVHARATGRPGPGRRARRDGSTAGRATDAVRPAARTGGRGRSARRRATAVADQLGRIGDDGRLRLLVAAESASALTAVEMGRVGLPWRAEVHEALLSELLGPRPVGCRCPPGPAGRTGRPDQRGVRPSGQPGLGHRAARGVPSRRVLDRVDPGLGAARDRPSRRAGRAGVQGAQPTARGQRLGLVGGVGPRRTVPGRVPAGRRGLRPLGDPRRWRAADPAGGAVGRDGRAGSPSGGGRRGAAGTAGAGGVVRRRRVERCGDGR